MKTRVLVVLLLFFSSLNAHAETSLQQKSLAALEIPESNAPRSAIRDSETQSPIEKTGPNDPVKLFGDWAGGRAKLSEHGTDLEVVYKLELNETIAGGVKQGTKTLGNVDIRMAGDFAKMMSGDALKGVTFFLYGLGDHGGDPTENVGDTQVTSNLQTVTDTFRLFEAWVQKLAFSDTASVLVGLHDLNSEFYVTETSQLFFNSSFGVGKDLSQTGRNGPSIFPVTAPCFRLRMEPTKQFYLQSAIFNAVSGNPEQPNGTTIRLKPEDGALVITEAALLNWKDEKQTAQVGKMAVGFWSYSVPFEEFSAKVIENGVSVAKKSTNFGYYILLDRNLSERFTGFLRMGFAQQEINQVQSNVSLGTVAKGLIPGRPHDRLGFAGTQIRFSDAYLKSQLGSGNPTLTQETAFEINYRFEFPRGIAFQPDYQYVLSPSGNPNIAYASIVAARLELNF